MNHHLLEDATWRGPLILAIQRALAAKFTATDWHELGYLTGFHELITGHDRLLRSLRFGDEDYGACVFQVVNHLAEQDTRALLAIIEHPKVKPLLEREQPGKLDELGYMSEHVPAFIPAVSASEVVRRALADADSLLSSSGAPSVIDRIHTAMHGYLKASCDEAGLVLPDGATLTQAYKVLRTQHPALKHMGEHAREIEKVLTFFASVLDALNTLRNHGSVAHPNDKLVEAAEGSLVVNATRTIFHYLKNKLSL